MLLNLSHQITNSGLPQDVQERYVRYKQGNRAIVAWMTSYGPDKYKGRKTLPIKQMIGLGKILCDRVSEIGSLPPAVDYYFRDVIKERTHLTRHFRNHRDQCESDDIDTVNHEHFTESLQQIHQILLTAGKPKQRNPASSIKKLTTSPSTASSVISDQQSRFSFATIDGDEQSQDSEEDSDSDSDTNATSECSHSSHECSSCISETSDQCEDFLQTDGPIAQGIETVIFLQQIEKISIAVRDCWTGTGASIRHFAASAAYTNILLQRAVKFSRDYIDSEPNMITFQNIRQIATGWHSIAASDRQQNSLEISEILAAVENSLNRCEPSYDLRPEVPNTSKCDSLISDLISSLPHSPKSVDRGNLTYAWLSNTGLLEGGSVDTAHDFRRCIILCLISLSHSAYSEALTRPACIALPRISALRLANEALSTIRQFSSDKSIFPCQCTNTLSYRIVQMQDELEKFAKFKCWSVLMQSPLVAGNQALEILHLCSYYGMHLFHYRHYVGSVLHAYNALVNLGSIDKVPMLDEVCRLFAPVLFATGKLPETGFMASWLRYIGARLKFRTGKKHQNHKDTWCMSIPAHTAARSAGLNISGKNDTAQVLPKFDYGSIDATMKLKHNQWILSTEQELQLDQLLGITGDRLLDQAYPTSRKYSISATGPLKSGNKPAKHKRSRSCTTNSSPPSNDQKNTDANACSNIHHSILSAFTRDTCMSDDHKVAIPPSRFNLLALFHSMTKVIAGISDTTHAEPQTTSSLSSLSSSSTTAINKGRGKGQGQGQGQMCICFAQTILQGADRILDTRKRYGLDAKGAMWSKNEKECIACFKDELLGVLHSDSVVSTTNTGSGGKWIWESVV